MNAYMMGCTAEVVVFISQGLLVNQLSNVLSSCRPEKNLTAHQHRYQWKDNSLISTYLDLIIVQCIKSAVLNLRPF